MSYVLASNLKGPLPLTIPVDIPLSGPVTFAVSGSAWSSVAGVFIGVDVLLDSALLGSSVLYSNGASEHRALPTQFFTATLDGNPHKITLQGRANTTTDLNDLYSVWVID